MLINEHSIPPESPTTVTNAEIFVENIKARYGVAKPITRQLISDFGLSLPKIFAELKRLGYPVPVDGQ